jgi:CheY-like chemotaxis protein/HPt (histidine-containing phosphotransfer) domain-containing protein
MLTAHGREEAQRHIEAFRLKVAAVLAKPIMPVALGRACARALGQVVSPGPALAPAPCSAAPALLRGARVLLVEDNEINRELALELLSRAGMIATAAVNGQEALDRLQDSDFDVVLMDCQMPLMDGFAATQALRRQPRLAQLPVIAMTADAMVGTRERAMAAGMNDYLTKPIRSAELFATLAHWLGARAVPLTPAPQPEPPANAAHQAELPAIAGLDVRAGLKSTLDDMALYRRALGLFARREAGFETQFRAAMAAQDHATLLRLVHDLKGTSATLGAERVNQHAKALEAILLGQPTNLVAAEPQRIATTEALRGLLADLAAAGIGA